MKEKIWVQLIGVYQ